MTWRRARSEMVQQQSQKPSACCVIGPGVPGRAHDHAAFAHARFKENAMSFDGFEIVCVPQHQHWIEGVKMWEFCDNVTCQVKVLQFQQQFTGDLRAPRMDRDVRSAPQEPVRTCRKTESLSI